MCKQKIFGLAWEQDLHSYMMPGEILKVSLQTRILSNQVTRLDESIEGQENL